jgi:hypothetical protein
VNGEEKTVKGERSFLPKLATLLVMTSRREELSPCCWWEMVYFLPRFSTLMTVDMLTQRLKYNIYLGS